jgi:hypothetical protein
VISSLNEFIKKHEYKVLSVDYQTAQFLKRDYEELKMLDNQGIQSIVDGAILSLPSWVSKRWKRIMYTNNFLLK